MEKSIELKEKTFAMLAELNSELAVFETKRQAYINLCSLVLESHEIALDSVETVFLDSETKVLKVKLKDLAPAETVEETKEVAFVPVVE